MSPVEAGSLDATKSLKSHCSRTTSSGHRGGSGIGVMFDGTTSSADPCHPA
ncbi:hypothetical protein GGQ88_004225 [Novosphingobium hassiacum]|uniref:Uncharacterized protein n=1 Tax=Novosphingobium hassiacum TaxID=173676 RepID=A0A7W6EY03_9SPHN|nr:hypothetical protein [Novosphingobium hassiacum]MBB3862922.1 hypothetical protein [Novosphingobium hassiacum]